MVTYYLICTFYNRFNPIYNYIRMQCYFLIGTAELKELERFQLHLLYICLKLDSRLYIFVSKLLSKCYLDYKLKYFLVYFR